MSTNLTNAMQAYTNGRYAQAVDAFLEILDVDRQNWQAWFFLATSYSEIGRVDSGYRIMQVISALCPDRLLKAKARLSAGRFEFELNRREFAHLLNSAEPEMKVSA